ncbi:MAG: transglycosylase domain-containing protein [Rikenellaceae bacterium]
MKIKNKKRFLWIFWMVVIAPPVLLFALLLSIGFGAFGKLPTFEELENPKSKISSEIISEDGVVIGSYFIENRSFVDYKDLSPHLVAALVATEDERFHSHSGIDFISLARVGFKTLLMGQKQGGGSTLSQQVAKNLYPRNTTIYSNSIARNAAVVLAKMKEWITAVMLERNYTKEEIIVMYFNVVEYGSNAFGIKSAAQTFFSKAPIDLTVEEAAVLVGVVNAPTRFSPIRNYDRSLTRRNTVLDRLENSGYIKKTTLDSIKQIPINLSYKPISHNEGLATYFRSMLSQYIKASEPNRKNYLTDWDYNVALNKWKNDPLYGWCNKNTKADGSNYDVYRDGIKIYTTINSKMQQYAEEAVEENMSQTIQPRFDRQIKSYKSVFVNLTSEEKEAIIKRSIRQSERYRVLKNDGLSAEQIDENFKKKVDMTLFSYSNQRGIDTLMSPIDSITYSKGFLRTGFVAIEPSSGYVKAYVGGTNHRFFQYDMASQGKRQPGSTFKPFIYTFAIDQLGFTPCDLVPNLPVTVDGWSPKEAGDVEQIGELRPLWWGLAKSRNNYSAWIMKQANQPKAVAEFINRLGISGYIEPVAPLCLGSADVSLFEMVSAYTNYVNNGVHIEPMFVTRIEDRHGNILATFTPQSNEVISSQSAYTMLNMLQKVVNAGTAARLRFMYKFTGEMGGKTGTSNNNSDSWFIGVTPKIVAGTWIGGEDRSTRFISGGEGSVVALPTYALFMEKVYNDKSLGISESDKFVRPIGATTIDCPADVDEQYDNYSQQNNQSSQELDQFFD